MSWGKLLQPDLVLGNSVLSLTPDLLKQHNLQGLVLDVDETLVPVSVAEISDDLTQWVSDVKPIAALWLVSNNISKTRISRIATALDLPYIYGAQKPSRRKLRQAVDAMGLPLERVAMVGDRLFTDVLVGNRLGMFTVLVEPMVDPAQEIRQNPARNLELWISRKLGATLNTVK
jgi:uncharacterized protein